MTSTRQLKFSKIIQKEISEILRFEAIKVYGRGVIVSVTEVVVSPDLSHAKVFISFFPDAHKNDFFAYINLHIRDIRKKLGDTIKSQVRHIPDLIFNLDDSQEYALKMEKLFKTIDIPKEDNDQPDNK